MVWLSSVVVGGKNKTPVLWVLYLSVSLFLSVPPTHLCICDSLVKMYFLPRHRSSLSLSAYQVTHRSIKRLFTRLRFLEQSSEQNEWKKGVFLEPVCAQEASIVWNFKPLGLVTVEQVNEHQPCVCVWVCVPTSWQCWVYMRISRR